MEKITAYFSKHPVFNSATHVVVGIGIGILITYPYVGSHPMRWGIAIIALGLLGHLYAWYAKK